MEFFCFDCHLQLCPTCVLDLHKDHKYEKLEQAGKKIKENIIEKLDVDNRKKEYKEKLQKNQDEQVQIKKKIEELNKDLEDLKKEEKETTNELNELDQKYQMIQNLSSFQDIYHSFEEIYHFSKKRKIEKRIFHLFKKKTGIFLKI